MSIRKGLTGTYLIMSSFLEHLGDAAHNGMKIRFHQLFVQIHLGEKA